MNELKLELKFKIGDKVHCTEDCIGWANEWKISEIVTTTDENNETYIMYGFSPYGYVAENKLVLVERAE